MTPAQKDLKDGLLKLAEVFRTCKTNEELAMLLQDFLTPPEQQDMLDRWKIVKYLLDHKTQREVKDLTGVSISKVSRGASAIRFGNGAFIKAHQRLKK